MTSSPHTLTVPLISAAVVASAKSYGDDPAKAFDPSSARKLRRSMTAAASALQTFTGQPATGVCRLLQIADTSLHHARKYGAPEFLSATAAAALALSAFGEPYEPPPSPPKPPRAPKREAKPMQPQAGPITAVVAPKLPSAGGPMLRAAREAVDAPARSPLPAARPARSHGYAAYGRATAVRLKPVEGRRLRYCQRFLRAGWSVEETAYLFDVHPDALAIASRLAAAC